MAASAIIRRHGPENQRVQFLASGKVDSSKPSLEATINVDRTLRLAICYDDGVVSILDRPSQHSSCS